MGGVPEKLHTNYPSRFELNENVSLVFGHNLVIENCKIDAIRFTEGKVHYDLAVPLYPSDNEQEQKYTYIENVDSVCVKDAD